MSTQTTRHGAPGPGGPGGPGPVEEEASLAARLPEIAARAAWAHRWRLAPFYLAGCTAAGVGMGHGLSVAGGLAAGAAAAEVAARTEVKAPDGQMLLSPRERHLVAIGLAGTGAWAGLVSSVGVLPWLGEAGLLAGVLAWPTHLWWASRRPQPDPEPEPSPYSPMAQKVLNGWISEITVGQGPRVMRGSVPIVETLTEPAEGALTIEMQLAKGVAAKNAISEANRRAVEALFVLPEDTVRLETVRDDSTRLRVVITASRHLEVEGGLDWPGPVLHEDGDVPLAVTGDGSVIAIPLFKEDGIRHGMITGTTRVGKSVSSVSVLIPGVKAGIEVILYLDGKRGTSAPYLRPIVARYARLDEQWPILIEIADRILKAREDRRGAIGLHEFHVWEDEDPIITVFIDEPNEVKKSRFFKAKHERTVLGILEHGGALGVRLIQCGQSPAGEDLIGGVQARALMSGGWSINHRAGGKGASRLTLDSTNASVSLLELPAGGAAITVAGRLVGFPAQVRNATKERVQEEIDGFTPRQLSGADLIAAGPEWHAAHWDDCFTPGYRFDATPATGTQSAGAHLGPLVPAQGPATVHPLDDVLDQLAAAVTAILREQGPMSVAQLGEATRLPDIYLSDVLSTLTRREQVVHTAGRYTLTSHPAGTTDLQDEELPASRTWVLDQLADHRDGLSLKQLEGLDGAPSRRTITNSLSDLMARGEVSKDGALWFRVQLREAVDDPDE